MARHSSRVDAEGQTGDYSSLDKRRYVSKKFLRLEFARMWPRVWQLAGLCDDLERPGS